ncbi:MAG: glycosyltransferase [Candidatus Saccharicenans sp.]
MDKPVVLFVAGSGSFGSGEMLLLDYLNQEKDPGFHPLLVFPSPGPLTDLAEKLGLECQVIESRDYLTDFRNLFHQPFSWVFNLFSFIKISSLIRKRRVRLVVSLSFMNWTGALAARQEGIGHLWLIRETLTAGQSRPRFFWGRWLASRLANDLSSKVILESAAAASLFQRKRTREKARIILPGIDAISFKSRLSEAATGKDQAKNIAVFWGSWNLKRFSLLVSLLEQAQKTRLKKKHPESKIEFFFPGLPENLVSKLQKILAGAELDGEVKDGSSCLEPGKWNSIVLAFIFPGFDPFSRFVLEAGLAGKPVLVDRMVPEELFVEFRTGFVCDEDRREEMSVLLEELMEDMNLRQQIGQEAEKFVLGHFSLERWKAEFERMIEESLN